MYNNDCVDNLYREEFPKTFIASIDFTYKCTKRHIIHRPPSKCDNKYINILVTQVNPAQLIYFALVPVNSLKDSEEAYKPLLEDILKRLKDRYGDYGLSQTTKIDYAYLKDGLLKFIAE